MYQGGYTGKILRVNLTEQSYQEEELSYEMARDYIGGAGFGIKYLFDEVSAGIDPLSADNKLIFAPGPFSGTPVPCASRMAVVGKSPLTGAVGMALTGGHFPVELKFAGYDALIIEGASEKLTYIWIKNGKVQFKNAKNLAGLRTVDCQQMIKNQLKDQNIRIACIGPAGENKSRMAAIINELRAFGRKGLGAVMGAKNLKAIAVRGETEIPLASQEKFKKARKEMLRHMKASHALYPHFSKHGTPATVDTTTELGIFPLKNFSATGEFSMVEEIGADAHETRKAGREHCYNCPVGCSQLKLVKKGPNAGVLAEGPEFETNYSYGGMTCVTNIDDIIAADRLADELGLDSISSGVAISFAMELYERGILTDSDNDGKPIKFGDGACMIDLLKKIAYREGIGDLLADGTRIAADRIGKNSAKYAMHIKGLELPGYDIRGAKAHGLSYATSYTGADHCRGYAFQEIFGIPIPEQVDRFEYKGKGKLTKWNQDLRTATTDCPTMCGFIMDMALPAVAAENTANLMEAVTGIPYTVNDIIRVGERVNNMARAFNALAGLTVADDYLPERLMTEPIRDGSSKGHLVSREEMDYMLREYFTERGWDTGTGIPTRERLESLDLSYVADRLKGLKGSDRA